VSAAARRKVAWGVAEPIVGMVHLMPLPGAPGWGGSIDAVVERALADAEALETGGVHGLLVENYGDVPFFPTDVPPATVAAMTCAVTAVRRQSRLPVGVNVLRNDARAALGIAAATGARFIRVNVHTGVAWSDQGPLVGVAHETVRDREALQQDVVILADVQVKHATPPAGVTLESAASDCWERGRADGLIVSGSGTGKAVDPGEIGRVKEAVPDAPVWVGSGVGLDSVARLRGLADGLIVGSALQVDGEAGRGVDPERVRAFMERAGSG
jgi:membrane complex biogenesis BtpA family protein